VEGGEKVKRVVQGPSNKKKGSKKQPWEGKRSREPQKREGRFGGNFNFSVKRGSWEKATKDLLVDPIPRPKGSNKTKRKKEKKSPAGSGKSGKAVGKHEKKKFGRGG